MESCFNSTEYVSLSEVTDEVPIRHKSSLGGSFSWRLHNSTLHKEYAAITDVAIGSSHQTFKIPAPFLVDCLLLTVPTVFAELVNSSLSSTFKA